MQLYADLGYAPQLRWYVAMSETGPPLPGARLLSRLLNGPLAYCVRDNAIEQATRWQRAPNLVPRPLAMRVFELRK